MDILGLTPDELQLRTEELIERQEHQDRESEREFLRRWNQPQTIAPQQAHLGLAWFPPDQHPRALQTWPSFAEDYEHGPYAAYCARLERLLRDLKSQGVKRLGLIPITIDDYLAWCTEHDRDPEQVRHPSELRHRAGRAGRHQSMATMLTFADRALQRGGLERFTYVSTAYVAGTYRGEFSEQDYDVGQGFRNPYERSKWESEGNVRAASGRLPVQIARPSIIVGEQGQAALPPPAQRSARAVRPAPRPQPTPARVPTRSISPLLASAAWISGWPRSVR